MRKPLLVAVVTTLLSAVPVAAQDTTATASNDWNSNYGFPSASSALVRLNRATLIEQQENGGLQSTTTINSTSSFNVDTMMNYDVQGDNNTLDTSTISEGNSSVIIYGDGSTVPITN